MMLEGDTVLVPVHTVDAPHDSPYHVDRTYRTNPRSSRVLPKTNLIPSSPLLQIQVSKTALSSIFAPFYPAIAQFIRYCINFG